MSFCQYKNMSSIDFSQILCKHVIKLTSLISFYLEN